jgi:hypothetical protein
MVSSWKPTKKKLNFQQIFLEEIQKHLGMLLIVWTRFIQDLGISIIGGKILELDPPTPSYLLPA